MSDEQNGRMGWSDDDIILAVLGGTIWGVIIIALVALLWAAKTLFS